MAAAASGGGHRQRQRDRAPRPDRSGGRAKGRRSDWLRGQDQDARGDCGERLLVRVDSLAQSGAAAIRSAVIVRRLALHSRLSPLPTPSALLRSAALGARPQRTAAAAACARCALRHCPCTRGVDGRNTGRRLGCLLDHSITLLLCHSVASVCSLLVSLALSRACLSWSAARLVPSRCGCAATGPAAARTRASRCLCSHRIASHRIASPRLASPRLASHRCRPPPPPLRRANLGAGTGTGDPMRVERARKTRRLG